MERELPTIVIEGTEFLFDIERTVLMEKGALHNEIDFRFMKDLGTHYGFTYSTKSRNHSFYGSLDDLVGQSEQQADRKTEIYVEIPRIADIDPEGMCRKYGCTIEDLKDKSDFEIMVDQEIFNERLRGIPVTIEFPGKTYLVDVARNVLEPLDGIGENIRLNAFHYDYYYEDDESYHLFYNIKENRVEDPLRDGTWGMTEGRVVLEIPSLYNLDQIGANISSGRDPRSFLIDCELKLVHVPKIVPWTFYNIEAEKLDNSDMEDRTIDMHRELPKYRLAQTDFLVDVKNRLLIDTERPENKLNLDALGFFQGAYLAYLDSTGMNAVETGKPGTEYQLPQMVVLDPEGMARLYGKTIEEIRSMTDFDLIVDQELFKRRMEGKLPEVDILGTTFFVDSYEGMLTCKASTIMLYELEPYLQGDYYEFPYNTASKMFTDLDFENITSIPENTFWIRMPLDWELDPVGHARLIGARPEDYCRMYPPKDKITAEMIAWENTKIYEITARNQKRLNAGAHEKKAERKSVGRRRGRGL